MTVNFTTWKGITDGQTYDIPDSVVSRPEDTDSFSVSDDGGLQLELKLDWPSIGAEISSETSGVTRAYLYEIDNDDNLDLIEDKDISDLSSGDPFAFEDVDLQSGEEVAIVVDAEGSDYDRGTDTDADDYPYEGDDIDIIGEVSGGSLGDSSVRGVNNIGNPQGIFD